MYRGKGWRHWHQQGQANKIDDYLVGVNNKKSRSGGSNDECY